MRLTRLSVLLLCLAVCRGGVGASGCNAEVIRPDVPSEDGSHSEMPGAAARSPSVGPKEDPVLEAIRRSSEEQVDFGFAVRRLIDDPRWTTGEKFEFLANEGERSGGRGSVVVYFLASLDWSGFVAYVSQRDKLLTSAEWHSVCVAAAGHRKEQGGETGTDGGSEYQERFLRLFLERVWHESDLEARVCMIATLNCAGVTVKQALALSGLLATETDPSVREEILLVQTQHNDSRTNAVVRNALRGPLERSFVHGLPTSSLVDRNRYDFLPDLRELRRRLAQEGDVRRKLEASQLERDVAKAIEVLEEKKARGAPIGGSIP